MHGFLDKVIILNYHTKITYMYLHTFYPIITYSSSN